VLPVLIVVGLVLAQDPPQMGLVPDEGVIQELTAASPDPAFSDGVHAGRLDVAEHGPDPGIGEDRIECGGLVRAAVPDHELDPVGFQNSATNPDLGFYAARSYSLMRPPRTGRCWIRSLERSATG